MNDFDRSEVETLKGRVDLAEVVRQSGLELRQVGKNLLARCPFHEDDKASLSVNSEAQLWNCFGCQAGGDVLSFLQLREGLAFPDALARLRKLAGAGSARAASPSAPPAPDPGPDPDRLPGEFTRDQLLSRVADLYRRSFQQSEKAQNYLESRGLGGREVAQAFGLGYADGSLLETLPQTGEVREALQRVGVLTAAGKEHLRGCVVVPLHHPDQGLVGLYGRRISRRARLSHLYLPGPKRGVLNWQALQASATVTVAESVLDAVSLWAAGVREVTCLYGVSSLHPDLMALLGRFGVREVRWVLDGDEPGRQAAERFSERLAERGIRSLRVVLPADTDPNGLLADQGPKALRQCVEQTEVLAVPEPEPESSEPRSEKTGDGFRITLGEVTYRATPRPPFTGRMKVTLKISRGSRTFLDSVDLYTHRSRAALANQLSRRMDLTVEEVEGHFLRLVEECEGWLEALSEESGDQPDAERQAPEMTAEEQEEALAFLGRPDLVEAILSDMEQLGYVGEQRGKLLAYLIGLSRQLHRPLSGIILSQSGAGKSGLAELVEQLTPPEDVVLYSRISAQALVYLPKDFLKRKLLILEERVGGEAADYHIRVLQSRQKLSQATVIKDPVTGKMQTRHFEVEGPIAYLETTTTTRLNHENATRCFEIHLDETEEQTRRIHQRQRAARTRQSLRVSREDEALCRRHHNAQRLLHPVRVVIPFVEHLDFPSRWLRTRRDHERFLCLVEAVTFLHQYQRPRRPADEDGVPWVEASPDDYQLAYELSQEVLGTTLHELSRSARELWEAARCMVAESEEPGELRFTRRDLRNYTDWLDHRLRDALAELVEMEYLEVVSGGSQGRTYLYRLVVQDASGPSLLRELTTPAQLRERLRKKKGGVRN